MKFIFLTGGVVGFVIAGAAGLSAGRSSQSVLFNAALGCLAGAVLFRWYWNVWLRGIRATYLARQRTLQPAAPAVKPSKP
jgi:hypothetical protein